MQHLAEVGQAVAVSHSFGRVAEGGDQVADRQRSTELLGEMVPEHLKRGCRWVMVDGLAERADDYVTRIGLFGVHVVLRVSAIAVSTGTASTVNAIRLLPPQSLLRERSLQMIV